MKLKQWPFYKFLRCLPLIAALAYICLYATPVNAESLWEIITRPFRKNEEIGNAPGRSRGAAVRDPDLCPYTQTSLTALVPNRNEAILTSKEYPSFWFYVPYQLSSDLKEFTLKFVLQDNAFNDIYSATFVMPRITDPGILSLQLTAEKAALEIDKTYRWYFLIYCNDEHQIYEPAFVRGQIQRKPLTQELGQLDLQTQLQVYGESNFWYELFDTLALNFWITPSSSLLTEGWDQTLTTIELHGLKTQPIVGRYLIPSTPE